jgi:hypothetical protein
VLVLALPRILREGDGSHQHGNDQAVLQKPHMHLRPVGTSDAIRAYTKVQRASMCEIPVSQKEGLDSDRSYAWRKSWRPMKAAGSIACGDGERFRCQLHDDSFSKPGQPKANL